MLLVVYGALGGCGSSTAEPESGALEAGAQTSELDPPDGTADARSPEASASILDEGQDAIDCPTVPVTPCPSPALSYADVSPIFERRCIICHSGATDGPWPLTRYDDIADWADLVRADLLFCSMPPPDSGVALSDDEKATLLAWVRCGLQE